jgi:plastocyanin
MTTRTVRRFTAVAGVVPVLALTACGGGGQQPPAPQEGQQQAPPAGQAQGKGRPVATIDVREVDFRLEPENVTIPRLGTVRFNVENAGQAPHALEVEGPRGEVETKVLQAGQSTVLTADLDRPGRYTWYCPVGNHRERGMEGRITVEGSGGASDDKGGSAESQRGDDSGGGGSGGGGYGY